MDQLRARIDALCVDAQVLLLRAQHEEMKAHVRTVQHDLAEALGLLEQPTPVPESRWAVVNAAVKSASLRLQMVEFALRGNGPNASEISLPPDPH
jgi:hypothetical protein